MKYTRLYIKRMHCGIKTKHNNGGIQKGLFNSVSAWRDGFVVHGTQCVLSHPPCIPLSLCSILLFMENPSFIQCL